MPDRTAQQGSGLLEGTDPRQDFYLDGVGDTLLTHHLVDQGSHAVDACISRRDDTDGLPLQRIAEGLLGTLTLGLHPAVDTEGVGTDVLLDEAEVVLVADDDVGGLDGLEYRWGDVLWATGADTCDDDFILFHQWILFSGEISSFRFCFRGQR